MHGDLVIMLASHYWLTMKNDVSAQKMTWEDEEDELKHEIGNKRQVECGLP
jgi:hypothetical protein